MLYFALLVIITPPRLAELCDRSFRHSVGRVVSTITVLTIEMKDVDETR